MKNKILAGLVIALGAVVILQGYYIFKISCKRMNMFERRVAASFAPPGSYLPSYLKNAHREIRDPFVDLAREQMRMRRQLDRIMENNFRQQPESGELFKKSGAFEPRVNFIDKGTEYIIAVDLPGMNKDKIKVEVQNRFLVISGERKSEVTQEKPGVSLQEVSYGNFVRSIRLPQDVLTKEISSEYNNGVLTVKIPKQQVKQGVSDKINIPVK